MAATSNEYSRLLITAADATGTAGTIPKWSTIGCSDATIGVLATVASSTLTGRWLQWDSQGNCVGVSVETTFTAVAAADLGTSFLCIPSISAGLTLRGAYNISFIVDSVGGSSPSFGLFVRTYNATYQR